MEICQHSQGRVALQGFFWDRRFLGATCERIRTPAALTSTTGRESPNGRKKYDENAALLMTPGLNIKEILKNMLRSWGHICLHNQSYKETSWPHNCWQIYVYIYIYIQYIYIYIEWQEISMIPDSTGRFFPLGTSWGGGGEGSWSVHDSPPVQSDHQ